MIRTLPHPACARAPAATVRPAPARHWPALAGLAVAVVMLAGCQTAPTSVAAVQDPAQRTLGSAVNGRAVVLERMALPPGMRLRVQLVDNQLADTPMAIMADQEFANLDGPPYAFSLPYDASRLRANGSYGLSASLYGPDGATWFVTDTRVAVVPGDATPVEFRLKRVGARP